jgi:hypothetical protein
VSLNEGFHLHNTIKRLGEDRWSPGAALGSFAHVSRSLFRNERRQHHFLEAAIVLSEAVSGEGSKAPLMYRWSQVLPNRASDYTCRLSHTGYQLPRTPFWLTHLLARRRIVDERLASVGPSKKIIYAIHRQSRSHTLKIDRVAFREGHWKKGVYIARRARRAAAKRSEWLAGGARGKPPLFLERSLYRKKPVDDKCAIF